MAVNSSPKGRPYHHGALKAAVLDAAARILERDGIAGLTLRGAAREAGVSHAAPKNHFGDLAGLLSELAASGYVRLREAMLAAADAGDPPSLRLHAIGAAYVEFARANPALFLLMFRSERLDMGRPALREAADALFGLLAGAVGKEAPADGALDEREAVEMALAWSQVHGLAMLLIDGRLRPILSRLPGLDEEAFVLRLLAQPAGEEQGPARGAASRRRSAG
jgi:AcrR family transcriptional regulator